MSRVVNTAPLIFLAKLDRLELLRLGADNVFVPEAVIAELNAKPDETNVRVEKCLGSWLHQKTLADPSRKKLVPDFGKGEVEVFLLADELGTKDVVLDDQDARRYARRLGLKPIGTLGLLLAARRKGLIPSLRAEIQRLRELGFRATEELVARILEEAGEMP